MWITVEKQHVFVDFVLGISRLALQGWMVLKRFPQLAPQRFNGVLFKKVFLFRDKFCNYKKVILLTHLSTVVITTNFKYKNFLYGVPRGLKLQGSSI